MPEDISGGKFHAMQERNHFMFSKCKIKKKKLAIEQIQKTN